MPVELIGNLGFPVAAFCLMYLLYRDEREDRREERGKWLEALEEHTEVLRSLKQDVREVATDGGEDQ